MAVVPVSPSGDAGAGEQVTAMGIAHVGTTTDARRLFLPAVLSLTTTPTSLAILFPFLLLALVCISLPNWLACRAVGRARRTQRSPSSDKILATLEEGGFGPETKSRISHWEGLNPSPYTALANTFQSHEADYPSCITAMARDSSSSTPSVLRPKARSPAPHCGSAATVSLSQGRYTGIFLPSSSSLPRAVDAWRGIPYAQSTAGQNRFRPPVPLPPEVVGTEARAADSFGQICPGTVARVSGIAEGEDCLNLNVYRPADWQRDVGGNGKMPVVVYVHGGAFNGGMGTERDMASFVSWADTPLLGINFNYRVGALGFPSCVVADREGCLNLGLRDQQMLFEWVKKNAGAFGGDVDRITVMGLSAGAHSIGYHLQSYTSANAPFHAAILESGGATARATLSPAHPRTEAQWREFLVALNVQPGSVSPEQLFPLLRSLPLDALLRASNAVFARYQDPIRWPFQPVIETGARNNGVVIPDLPISNFRRGAFLRIPILTGFNTNEGAVFCHPRVDTNEDFLGKFTTMIPGLTQPDLGTLSKLYPDPTGVPHSPFERVPQGFGKQWARYEAAYADYAYICPVLQTGHFYSQKQQQQHGEWRKENNDDDDDDECDVGPPVWVYHFAPLSRPDFGGTANHGDEAPVVAHDMGAIGAFPGLVRTADAMHSAWVHFIATGDPNGPRARPRLPVSAGATATATSSSSSSTTTTLPFWPRFSSPFVGDTDTSPGRLRPKGPGEADRLGRVMVFGSGNDERLGDAGGRAQGTPAQVARLTETETAECGYWWERVELSEGMGRRVSGGARARL